MEIVDILNYQLAFKLCFFFTIRPEWSCYSFWSLCYCLILGISATFLHQSAHYNRNHNSFKLIFYMMSHNSIVNPDGCSQIELCNKERAFLFVLPGTDTLRFAMIGMTGAGKSATGNMIAARDGKTMSKWEKAKEMGSAFVKPIKKAWNKYQGEPEGKPFISRADSESVTQEPSRKDFVVFGQRVAVIDTPGFVDTKCSEEKIVRDILTSMYMLAPGPHAIVMVVKADRQTEESIKTIKRMKEVFGPDVVNFLIIVFTGIDNVTRDGDEIDDYVQKLKESSSTNVFRDLLRQAGDRYVGFDNTLDPFSEENGEQVQKLINITKQIVKRNNNRCYSHELLKETYQRLREEELHEQADRKLEEVKHALALNMLKEAELCSAKDYQEKMEKHSEDLSLRLRGKLIFLYSCLQLVYHFVLNCFDTMVDLNKVPF